MEKEKESNESNDPRAFSLYVRQTSEAQKCLPLTLYYLGKGYPVSTSLWSELASRNPEYMPFCFRALGKFTHRRLLSNIPGRKITGRRLHMKGGGSHQLSSTSYVTSLNVVSGLRRIPQLSSNSAATSPRLDSRSFSEEERK
ncbi:hypothetical protein KP509_02G089400 [Ceratopteris richardii]|uniref:Uncharacterized protein n=1 Tax=Ceratopteris richardii TaxID=49495 RepID=A0A8T2VFD3_CERRI|nr:hypothetical protein KP509_02G089400 [Ceratopteris richardii]